MSRAAWMVWLLAFAPAAWAHPGEHPEGSPGPRNWPELLRAWEFDPGVVLPLAASAWLYGRGLARLWRSAGVGRGVRLWEAAAFATGWASLAVALVSPLHPWGGVLFSAHMTQHEILMLVSAPLLILGRPVIAIPRALPAGWAGRAIRWARSGRRGRFWAVLARPLVAWLVHAAVLWTWHVPALFDATIDSDLVHAVQHLSFLLSALLFWWSVLEGRHRATGYGVAILYLFTTAVHSGLLGALITLAPTPWYDAYRRTTSAWGLSPLEDQQLGGLIMWVPACLTYIGVALVLWVAWLRASEERVVRWEDRLASPEAEGS